MRRLVDALYSAALTLWVGGVWTIGYVVAPTLFAAVEDRQLAGLLAGKLFISIGWVGLGCAAYLLPYAVQRAGGFKGPAVWLPLLMLTLTAVSLFGIQPLMAELKTAALPRDVMESVFRDRFVTWHGISSILYLAQSVLGLCLVIGAGRGVKT